MCYTVLRQLRHEAGDVGKGGDNERFEVVDSHINTVDRRFALACMWRRRRAPHALSHIHSISDIYALARRDAHRGAHTDAGANRDPGTSVAHPIGAQPDTDTANSDTDTTESHTETADSNPDAAAARSCHFLR